MDLWIKGGKAIVCASSRETLDACACVGSPRPGFEAVRHQQLDGGSCRGIV